MLMNQPLAEHGSRRALRSPTHLRELFPAVLRVERKRLRLRRVRGQQSPVVGLTREQRREQAAADSPALALRSDVELHDLEVRRVEPLPAGSRIHRGGHAIRPPLPVVAGIAIREAEWATAVSARDEEDEVRPGRVTGQRGVAPEGRIGAVRRLLGRQAVDLEELVELRERIGRLDLRRRLVRLGERQRAGTRTSTTLSSPVA
jgi:hypothetical protein